jgi:hypothetical protein
MFMRQERIALLLLMVVAVTVITAHIALSMIGKHPFARPFSEHSLEGDLVVVKGTVGRAVLMENGGHVALVVENISVFIPSAAARGLTVHKNDTIALYGIVQTYRGKKEVLVNSREDIRITTTP